MSATTVTATAFKAKCLALIDEMNRTKVPIIVTNRGKPVAEMFPARTPDLVPQSLLGAMKNTVYSYDDPFGPAIDPNEWEANR
jgi:prevent-host-death family protein